MKIWEQMQKTAPSKKIEAKTLDQKNKIIQEENVSLRSETYRVKTECSIKTAEADALRNQLKSAHLEIQKLKESNNKMRDACAQFEKELRQKDNTFSVIISEFKKTHERLKHDLRLAQQRYTDDKGKLNKMLEVACTENQNLQNKIAENNASIQAMSYQLNTIKQAKISEIQHREQNYKKSIEKLNFEKKYAEEQIQLKNHQLQNQKNLLFQEKKDMSWEIAKLNKIIKEKTIDIDKAKNLYNQKNQEIQFYSNEKIKELGLSLQGLRKELDFKKHKENLSNEKLATLNRQLNENEKFINEFSENFKKQELLLQKLKEEKVKVINNPQLSTSSVIKIASVKTPTPAPKHSLPKYDFSRLPSDFCPETYKKLNQDLSGLTPTQLKEHYLEFGQKEARTYTESSMRRDHGFANYNNIKLYQIYYDQKHIPRILNHAIPYFNNNPTIYFESGAMCDIFNKKDYTDCEYIGVLSWKASTKIKKMKNLSQIDSIISKTERKYDFYTFNNKNFLGFTRPHRGSGSRYDSQAWRDLMKLTLHMQSKKIWPQVSEEELDKEMLRIYCNYFIAKKEIWEDFVESFVIPAIQEMKNDEQMRNIATSSHHYPLPLPQSFIDAVGCDYYPMAPFILERLINVYIVMRNLKVGFVL
jgi:hypothetical protein